eukprot:scaffold4899_cov377-Prasinococcus_capsulatus_cf.AAC.2
MGPRQSSQGYAQARPGHFCQDHRARLSSTENQYVWHSDVPRHGRPMIALSESLAWRTLDTLIPAMVTDEEAGSNADATITEDDLKDSMKELIAMLKEVEGVDDVRLGRTAEEKRVVSQELELWISRVPMAEDSTGYNLHWLWGCRSVQIARTRRMASGKGPPRLRPPRASCQRLGPLQHTWR